MNTKILALTILIISAVSAQSTAMTYNATSCAATRTSLFCQTAQGSNASLPVCATVNFTGNVSNRIVTGNIGYYCLPLALALNPDVVFNATHNISVTASTTNNAANWSAAAGAWVTCTKYADPACATNTVCSSRSYGLGLTSTTVNLTNQCIASSMANMTAVAAFPTNSFGLTGLNWVTNSLAMPSSSGGDKGNGNGDKKDGNAALIKYSIGAVASLLALTFF